MNYIGEKIVNGVLASLSRNETMERIRVLSEPSMKLAVGQLVNSIEDPVNNDLINTHLIGPMSIYVSDRMKPHAVIIICLFVSIAVVLVFLSVMTIKSGRTMRKLLEHRNDIESV